MLKTVVLALALFVACPQLNAFAAPATAQNSATMPACSANDPVVWVNTRTKVYHAQGDRYFGKTKSGTYACTSKAVAMGARAADAKNAPPSTSKNLSGRHRSASPAPTDDADASMTPSVSQTPGSRKKRRHKETDPSPSPAP